MAMGRRTRPSPDNTISALMMVSTAVTGVKTTAAAIMTPPTESEAPDTAAVITRAPPARGWE